MNTSSSVASLQKAMPWLRQNDFVQAVQDDEADRGEEEWSLRGSLLILSSLLSLRRKRSSDVSEKRERESPWCSCSGPSGMMVLFLKQVHLQKVGAAKGLQGGKSLEDWSAWGLRTGGSTLTGCGNERDESP